MHEDKFITAPFPEDEDIVYVLRFQRPGESGMIPFYVGESRRGTRRIGDYITAQFSAATDFKVGIAVKALRSAECRIFVSHQPSANRRKDEAELIARYTQQGHKLLNAERSYNYRSADKAAEQTRIEQFVASLVQRDPHEPPPSAA